ncbi:carboxypeptidase regulatory-like domain-containing protein, partial [Flavobacteriaceae bacterium]|nr:carboxypeptidase regulatory-like domain-containing protein [Flavobacteriaceae bacterium]
MLKRSFYLLLSFLIIYSCASDIPLAINGNISGTVNEQGSSNTISGVNIALSGESTQSTISGSSGTFSFNNIPAGNYVLTASKAGYVEDARPTTVNIEKTSSVTFTLQKKLPTANPNSLELTFDKKEETIELKNNQADVLNFTTSTSKTWLTVSPSTGSIQSNNALIITVKADFTTLSPGTYDETLVINVEGSTLSIPIKITYTQPPYITVTKPSQDEVYKMGETLPIKWDSNLNGKVKIELTRASSVQLIIETETENKEGGSYDWFVPAMESEYYKIKITSKENPDVDFTTEPFKIDKGPTKPVVTTAESPKETGINFIKIEGTIVSLGVLSDKVDQYGHVYSINNQTPTVADNRTKYGESTETKTYTSDLTSLQSAETYYIRAYATNAKGTSYGAVVTATTVAGGPIVSTSDVTDITQTSAKSGGNITSDGGSTITERGLFYGITEELNADSSKVKDSGTSTGEFTSSITELTKGTKYYVMAYGKNSSGYGYGEIKSFNTVGDPPTVETSSVDKISGTKAETNGKVTSNGGEPLTSYGFAYGKSSSPTIENNKWEIGTTDFSGEFKGLISGLETSTKYYVRAYATNARGTSYGVNKDFTTTNGLPGVSTVSSESVNGNSAVINGKINDNGGSTLTSYGFAYAESPNPTIEGFKIEVGTDGDGEYNGKITDLKPSTKYYVKAYATNGNGTSYGDQIDFTTTDGLPKVNTVGSRDIVGTKATLTGTIVDNGGQALTSYGFVYAKTQNPTLDNSKITVGEDSTGGYSGEVTGLETLTKYYYRAYATNPAGTAYGTELSLTTLDGLAEVQTTEIKDITSGNAKAVGKIISDGGEEIKEYGFVYSIEESPTIESNKVTVTENTDNVFEGSLSNLTRLTKYYVRAFVTNSAGTAYGSELSLTTLDGLPKVTTVEVKDIEVNSAKAVGKIDSDGGEEIKEYGFVYSIEESPTIESNKVLVTENTDNVFEGSLSNLTRLTKYYVRAFVTNMAGTAYGDELNFTSKDGPYFTITAPTLNQSLLLGSSFNITWDTNKSDDTVTIEHWIGDTKTELSNDTAINAKSFAWNISEDITTGSENIIKITENKNSEKIYESPNFVISALTYVPDDVFESILIHYGYDDVMDDYVKTSNIKDVTELKGSYTGLGSVFIKDPTGIEDFTSLTYLNWPGVKIESLDLSNLINLEKIIVKSAFVTSNQAYLNPTLTSIILPDTETLKELNLNNNALTSIDVSKFSNLEDLYFGLDNGISKDNRSSMPTTINLTSNQKLKILQLTNANFENIDITGITSIEQIIVYNNYLTSLDVSALTDLKQLWVFGNEKLSCVKATQDQINNVEISKDDNQIVSTDCTKTYVPDDNFEQFLIDSGYDSVLDDYVLKANIMGILNLDISDKDISDVEGIQDFIG